jgi:tetratricopeptide (TPR) repeat protein
MEAADQIPDELAEAIRRHRGGDPASAIPDYERFLAGHPERDDIRLNLGAAHAAGGNRQRAAAEYERILAANPGHGGALYNLGNLKRAAGDLSAAGDLYARAAAAEPRNPSALIARGQILTETGRSGEALGILRRAVRLAPASAPAWNALGAALWYSGKAEAAAVHYRRALALDPGFRPPLSNLGVCLRALGQLDEALNVHLAATRAAPGNDQAWTNLGVTRVALNDLDGAIAAYDRALEISPNSAEARFNRGVAKLLKGDFAGGFADYESRWQRPDVRLPAGNAPLWQGGDIRGKRLLLFAEQGYGDVIQFIRYAPLLKERGAEVLLYCQPELVRLLERAPGVDRAVSRTEAAPPHDFRAPILGLPHLLDTVIGTVPSPGPYLPLPEPSLPPSPGRLRAGIVWAGSPTHGNDRNRSCRLEEIMQLAELPAVDLVSLQKGKAAEALTGGVTALVANAGRDCSDFLDTARVTASLDLVITVDTSVAHLAGAMGVRVWTLLPFAPDWRWMLESDGSPWYRTMRLFRQKRADEGWAPVIASVRAELARLAEGMKPADRA